MKGYKVVANISGRLESVTVPSADPECRVYNSISYTETYTKGRVHYPLFVFDTEEHAKEFRSRMFGENHVYEVDYVPYKGRLPKLDQYQSSFKELQECYEGTLYASKVKLIKEIE